MGFLVSFSFFFLALVINQSTVVGQTTAESVIEFPKNDIRDVRSVIIRSADLAGINTIRSDITVISMSRKNAVVYYSSPICVENHTVMKIGYNNGVTEFNETWTSLQSCS